MLETRRAKERAKEGGRVPFESSDTRLGAGGREFESRHSDQENNPLDTLFFQGAKRVFLFLILRGDLAKQPQNPQKPGCKVCKKSALKNKKPLCRTLEVQHKGFHRFWYSVLQ